MQSTVRHQVRFEGIGLHSGKASNMIIHPAPENYGIKFKVCGEFIDAHFANVDSTPLCTKLVSGSGAYISTIEHLMAALWLCGVTNALIESSASEIPILDGSSHPFVMGIKSVGLQTQNSVKRRFGLRHEVTIAAGLSTATLRPAQELTLDVAIEFTSKAIGYQKIHLSGDRDEMSNQVSRCRTFCFVEDIERMRQAGLALGGSIDNAVIFTDRAVINESGLRADDEPVRHKALDTIGDLYLLGGDLLGHFSSFRGGHKLTNQLLRLAVADGAIYDLQSGAVVKLNECALA